MGRRSRPPRVAEWLLLRLLPVEDAESVRDDVAERYARDIAPSRSALEARLWYWGELARSVVPGFRLRRLRGSVRQRGRRGWRVARGDLSGWLLDARPAWRALVRRPGTSAAAVVILALGIGGTTAIFGAVRALLTNPLPYGDESRIVAFTNGGDWSGPEFMAVREWAGPFEAVSAGSPVEWTFRAGSAEAGVVPGFQATARLFDVLGVSAVRGRVLRAGDDVQGAEPVVVLSHEMWTGELGADPDVVGRQLVLDGVTRTVIGVMPESFFFPTPATRFWAAMPMSADLWDYGLLYLYGRTVAGVGVEAARSAMPALAEVLRSRFEYGEGWDKTRSLGVNPVRRHLVGDSGRPVILLLAAVALLLLVACGNVSALVLVRTLERRGGLAVRAALGASRTRLVLQSFTESLVLAVSGGIAGGVAAYFGFGIMRRWLPVEEAWRQALVPDWTMALFALGVTIAAGVLIGLVAVRAVGRAGLESTLRGAGRPGRSASVRALPALIAGEIALTVVLVVSAAALVRSVANLERRDTGLDPEGVLAIDVAVGTGDFDAAGRHDAFSRVLERVRAVPGISAAGLTQRLPFRDRGWQGPVWSEERPEGDDLSSVLWRHVTPGFFETLGLAPVRGRVFTESDDGRAPGVVVVSRGLAEALWPGLDPIGRRMRTGMTPAGAWLTVVGLVEDVPLLGLRDPVRPVVFVPWSQAGVTMESNAIVVRSAMPAANVLSAVRSAIADADGRVAVARTQSMESVMRQSIAEPRQLGVFLNLFGGLALLLGAVGVYGVLAHWVRGRLFEFGVRLALGATPGAVVRLVLSRAGLLLAAGVATGLPLSIVVSRAYSTFLFGVEPAEAMTLGWAVLVLSVAGSLAAWLPCRLAARADPVAVLRSD